MYQVKGTAAEKPKDEPVAADQAQAEKKPRRRNNNKKPKEEKETPDGAEAQAPLVEATPEGPAPDGEKKEKRKRNPKK